MIRTFGTRPEIRELARAELLVRDGKIGAVAEAFAGDFEMCGRILKVLAPLPRAIRLGSIAALGAAASSNGAAFSVLSSARHDTDGATAGEAVMAWTEVCVARDAFGTAEARFLIDELDAVGQEYQHRRAAGVAGLAIADKLDAFPGMKERSGKPLDVDVGYLIGLDKSDRYLKRIFPRWTRIAGILGGDDAALGRLEPRRKPRCPFLIPARRMRDAFSTFSKPGRMRA